MYKNENCGVNVDTQLSTQSFNVTGVHCLVIDIYHTTTYSQYINRPLAGIFTIQSGKAHPWTSFGGQMSALMTRTLFR